MNCSENLSNVICGTKKSVTFGVGFFATIVFLFYLSFISLNIETTGQHGKGNTMGSSNLPPPSSSLVLRH